MDVEQRIGYRFRDRTLLERALSHASMRSLGERCNERLEFLGDAVLGMLVGEFVFDNAPDLDQGELTRARAATVSNRSLAKVARELGLEHALSTQGLANVPRKALADAFEALVGAVYLDGGLDAAREMVLGSLGDTCSKHLERPPGDFKSTLQQAVQMVLQTQPEYRTIAETGPPHDRRFGVAALLQGKRLGTGWGRSKKEATQAAACEALQALRELGRNDNGDHGSH